MLEKAPERLIGSGIANSEAPLGACARVAMARPDISVPMMIPKQSVKATRNDARNFRFLAQSQSSRISIPILVLLRGRPMQQKFQYSIHSDAASLPRVAFAVTTKGLRR
jgi:hypothetical protein